MFTLKFLSIVLFVIMYILMIMKADYRPWIALGTAVVFMVLRILPLSAVPAAINWNVLLMITGTMVVVDFFIASRMPNRIADVLLEKSKNVMWVTICMSLFAGVISAFIDNVATVLMVAPVGLAVCEKLEINPVSMLIAIAVSSNLQGAATLVGDTTSIMLGAYAGMDFMDFFWMNGRPGIFWAVELGAVMTVPIMMYLFRDQTQSVDSGDRTEVSNYIPTILLCGLVLTLICVSFIPEKPDVTNGLICMLIGVLAIVLDYLKYRDAEHIKRVILNIDYQTLLLLLGLFLVIQGITEAGVIDDAARLIAGSGSNIFLLYTIIVWASVIFSAFIDNIPYVATMLPVITRVATVLGIQPYLLYFGLLTGATLGGNLTPIGASANITAVGMLKKMGYDVSFKDFMRIGIPFTLAAVMSGYVFIWIFWH